LDSILEENPEFYPYKLINRLDDVLWKIFLILQ
jgi:hypothetical protein